MRIDLQIQIKQRHPNQEARFNNILIISVSDVGKNKLGNNYKPTISLQIAKEPQIKIGCYADKSKSSWGKETKITIRIRKSSKRFV
jgi:hypothetical protein